MGHEMFDASVPEEDLEMVGGYETKSISIADIEDYANSLYARDF